MPKVKGWRPHVQVRNQSGRALQVTAAYDEKNGLVIVNIYVGHYEVGHGLKLDNRTEGRPLVKLIKAKPDSVRVPKRRKRTQG